MTNVRISENWANIVCLGGNKIKRNIKSNHFLYLFFLKHIFYTSQLVLGMKSQKCGIFFSNSKVIWTPTQSWAIDTKIWQMLKLI